MKRFSLSGLLVLLACAPGGGGSVPAPVQPAQAWPVETRIHVDLWLHGYAMLLVDTSTVPVFRRGYREHVKARKTQLGVRTLLDDNEDQLQARLIANPALVNGQFAPMYFADFPQMQRVIDLFLRAEGSPGTTNDPTLRQYFAVLNAFYPSAADRQWLRTFVQSLADELQKFYQGYWTSEQAGRIGYVRRADSLWQDTYRDKLRRFLNNTQQENGEMILALTLGGEGRTVNFSSRQNAVAVTMPDEDPREAFYVFAHEVVNGIVGTAVNDNLTPAEQRQGLAGRYITTGTVRAGAMLLAKAAPELVPGYTRYYLHQANLSTEGDIDARLVSAFPLPVLIRDAIARQIDVVLGGI